MTFNGEVWCSCLLSILLVPVLRPFPSPITISELN